MRQEQAWLCISRFWAIITSAGVIRRSRSSPSKFRHLFKNWAYSGWRGGYCERGWMRGGVWGMRLGSCSAEDRKRASFEGSKKGGEQLKRWAC